MINKENEKVLENVKLKISISNFDKEENIEMNQVKKNIFKFASVACLMLVLTTGVVFAKDIEKFIKYYFGNDKLINEAAERGYVEEVSMNSVETENTIVQNESGEIVDDVDVSVKIDEFLIDDANLSMNFSFEFDAKVKDVFDLDNVQFMTLQDLIVFDEKNKILYTNCNKVDFERMCKVYKLDYTFDDYYLNDNATYSSELIEQDKENNILKYNYNFEAQKNYFPNSKELNFVFTKIRLEKYEYNGEDVSEGELLKSKSVIFTDDWKINIIVPEIMYNRENIEYKAVSISHPDFELVSAIASETGFKFNSIISNVNANYETDEYDELISDYMSGKITEEEFESKVNEDANIAIQKYMKSREIVTTDYMYLQDDEKTIDNITHIESARGKKFKMLDSSLSIIDFNDNRYEFYGTFEMTKYDVTDKMTVVIIFYGEPVYIELEKIN